MMEALRRTGWQAHSGVVAALLVALFLQAVLSMRLLNASYDEPFHLVSGYAYWRTGEIRLNPEHPPLIKLLAALPLHLLRPLVNVADPSWVQESPDSGGSARPVLYTKDADRLLFWGRLAVVFLSLLLGLYVYRWARELFGTGAGLMALFLYALCPNIIAHSRFVTMDLGLSCFFLIALYYLWRFCHEGGRRNLIAAGLGLGLALATKFSAVLLLPTFALLLAFAAVWSPEPGQGSKAKRGSAKARPKATLETLFTIGGRGTRLRLAAMAYPLLLLIAFVVVYAVYLFPSDILFYWRGMNEVQANHDPNYPDYLFGQFKKGGWWYYFLAAFLIKTPIPILILLLLSIVLVRRFPARHRLDEAFLVVPAVIFFGFTSAMANNLGLRYILPVYPLVFVFVSRLASFFSRGRLHAALASVLGAWLVIGAIRIYPDHLAYFNELVGGPENGWKYLDDSNIDWGTDLKRLKRYMEEHGIDRFKLAISSTASADHPDSNALHNLNYERVSRVEWMRQPLPGIYAVSTNALIRGELYAKALGWRSNWLTRYQPIGRVGYGFYVFKFDGPDGSVSGS